MQIVSAEIMIKLPWPSPILSPNNHSHWTRKAKAKAAFREECKWIGLKPPLPQDIHMGLNIPLMLIFHPPSKRKYDIDNLLASMKSGLDGLADAWAVNDTRFRPITIDFGDVRKGGEVIVSIVQK